MKKYKDLDLNKIRDDNGLDFAHYTYRKGMCSCCYGPKDLAKIHWKGRTIPKGDDYTYLLFKNADNGSGTVTANDIITNHTYIEWRFPLDKLHKVCSDLQEQLGPEYTVLVPYNSLYCIGIVPTRNLETDCDWITGRKLIEHLTDKFNREKLSDMPLRRITLNTLHGTITFEPTACKAHIGDFSIDIPEDFDEMMFDDVKAYLAIPNSTEDIDEVLDYISRYILGGTYHITYDNETKLTTVEYMGSKPLYMCK